jgi:2-methylcitrate dehydratase PrpD
MAVKLVPGAHAFHPSVEAAVEAARKANVEPEEVSQILFSGPQQRSMAPAHKPKDLIEAIHSLPYFLASAVADRDFSWVHATEEKIHSPVMQSLIERVAPDPAPPDVHYEWGWGGTVRIVTRSGESFVATVDAPRASGPRGIHWRDVEAKYSALMPDSGLDPRKVDLALAVIHGFEQVDRVSQLTALLS